MATPVLLDSDIKKGKELVDWLEKSNFDVEAAFWHHDPDEDRYSLWIATPWVDEFGPLQAYGHVRAIMSGLAPSERVASDAIRLVGVTDVLVRGLRGFVSDESTFHDTWLYSTPLAGAYFNEGYLYFVGRIKPKKKRPA